MGSCYNNLATTHTVHDISPILVELMYMHVYESRYVL